MEIMQGSVILQDAPSESPEKERLRILELVRRFGGCTTDAILDPSMQFFHVPTINGMISYRLTSGCAIIFGDPTCSETDKAALATAFHRFAQGLDKSVIYIAASESFAKWAIDHICQVSIEFGKELILDPFCDPRKNPGTYGSLVRRKVKGAIREGVSVQEYEPKNEEIEKAIEEVGKTWLRSRRGLQVHISNVYMFEDRIGKRWLYAKKDDTIIGVISLNQLQAHKGWLLNHLMIVPGAPNGTSELLVVSALEALENEGCRFVTVGLVTTGKLENIVGLSKPFTWIAGKAFKMVSQVAHLDGLNTFWGKFHPHRQPSYLLFSRNRIGLREILALKSALNGNP